MFSMIKKKKNKIKLIRRHKNAASHLYHDLHNLQMSVSLKITGITLKIVFSSFL